MLQVGILWGDINQGFPFSIVLGSNSGQEVRINTYRSEIDPADAASVVFNPYRVTICDGGQQTQKTQRAHYPVARKSELFTILSARCMAFYEDIITVAPEPDVPMEQWGDLVSERGVLIEFRAVIPQDIIKWLFDRSNTPPGAPSEIKKLLIIPEENAGGQSVCLYVLSNDRIIRVFSPSANYYDMQKLISDSLLTLTGAADDSEIQVVNPGSGVSAIPIANPGSGVSAIPIANPGSGVSESRSISSDNTDIIDSPGVSSESQDILDRPNVPDSQGGVQETDAGDFIVPAAEQDGTAGDLEIAATTETQENTDTATAAAADANLDATNATNATYKPGDNAGAATPQTGADSGNIRYMTINEVGGGRFPDFSPDVFCIVEGPKTNDFRRIRYTAPTEVRDKSELEDIILASDIYSYNRSIDYNDTLVFKNITSIYRLYQDGFMEYNYIPLTQPGEKGSLAAALENTLVYVMNIERRLLGSADLILSGIYLNESDLTYRFTFDYIIDDYPVFFYYEQMQGDSVTVYQNAITVKSNAGRVVSCRWMLVDLFFASDTKKMQIYFDRIDVEQSLTKMAVSDIAIAYSIDMRKNAGAGADKIADTGAIAGAEADAEQDEAAGSDPASRPGGAGYYEWPVWAITSPEGAVEIVKLSEG